MQCFQDLIVNWKTTLCFTPN